MSAHRATRRHHGLTVDRLGITVTRTPRRRVRDLDLSGVLSAVTPAR